MRLPPWLTALIVAVGFTALALYGCARKAGVVP